MCARMYACMSISSGARELSSSSCLVLHYVLCVFCFVFSFCLYCILFFFIFYISFHLYFNLI